MKYLNMLLILIFTFVMNAGYAASINDDVLKIGKPESTASKILKLGNTKQIRANESTGKIEFSHDGAIFKNLGSGAGGGSGAVSILENGGFEDGINSGWEFTPGTVTALSGSDALLGDTSVRFDPSSQNDYLRTVYLTVPKGLRGSACEARFLYTGLDGNSYAQVETQSGVVLGRYQRADSGSITYGLPPHSIASYESIWFKCPTEEDVTASTTNGNIRIRVYQGTATNGAAGDLDDFHFGALIGLSETVLPDVLSAKINASGVVTSFNTPIKWINDCTISSTANYSCNFALGVFTQAPSCVATVLSNTDTGGGRNVHIKTASQNQVGYLTDFAPNTLSAYAVELICQKQGADAKQSVQVYKSIPKVSENINTFYVNVKTNGTFSGQNADWIQSCTAATSPTCTFKPGIFTQVPACWFQHETTGYNGNLSASLTQVTGQIWNNQGVAQAHDRTYFCSKTGSDFKLPTVQPIVIGQVTSSSAMTSLKNTSVEMCRIENSGTASISVNSGLCSGWVQSVSRTAVGVISVTFVPGAFSQEVVCTGTVVTSSSGGPLNFDSESSSGVRVMSRDHSGSFADKPVSILCLGRK